jgi:hypothetical protein
MVWYHAGHAAALSVVLWQLRLIIDKECSSSPHATGMSLEGMYRAIIYV